jgi:glycolate oxidase iron-sulfur subunit
MAPPREVREPGSTSAAEVALASPPGAPARAEREPRGGGAAGARDPSDDCIHCGFCLPTCPTWQNWQEEMDSPRGRIDLFRALEDGRLAMSPAVAEHFDRCLGCMACLTSCPSGVRYDHVIDRARVRVEREYRRPFGDRLWRGFVFALFTRPAVLRLAAILVWLGHVTGLRWLARRVGLLRVSARLAAMDALAPTLTWGALTTKLPARTPARGERRLRAGLLGGCVQRVFFPNVNGATIRVLAAEGIEVVVPAGQGCCGALSVHAGRGEEARRLARDLVERFEREAVDVVVVNAAGCGSHLKDLPHVFADDAEFLPRARAFAEKVRDVSELLASVPARAPRHPIEARVAFHSPCHLGHAQRIVDAPRSLLGAIPGLELVDVPDGEQCCGSAGIYNLVQPRSADEIGRRKAEAVLSTKASLLASANPGCSLQIRRMIEEAGAHIEAAHPVEILDRSIAREPER